MKFTGIYKTRDFVHEGMVDVLGDLAASYESLPSHIALLKLRRDSRFLELSDYASVSVTQIVTDLFLPFTGFVAQVEFKSKRHYDTFKLKHPEIYDVHVHCFEGYKKVLEQKITRIDDVYHFTEINHELY